MKPAATLNRSNSSSVMSVSKRQSDTSDASKTLSSAESAIAAMQDDSAKAKLTPETARAYAALSQPFAGHLLEEPRSDAMLVAAGQLPLEKTCVEALSSLDAGVQKSIAYENGLKALGIKLPQRLS